MSASRRPVGDMTTHEVVDQAPALVDDDLFSSAAALTEVTERVALALQGALLVRHAPAAVADAFCASRLAGRGGRTFGTLRDGTGCTVILERAHPAGGV